MRLFDAHCHLQDDRIYHVAPQLIRMAVDSGVLRFAVNGVSERDWHLVKEMGDHYPSIIPCFGLHPWYVSERSSNWLKSMREFLNSTPSAAVGEVGLDKGSRGKEIDFLDQVDVFRQQLELAKELERPVSIHCVRAYGDLLEIMQSAGPFPAGVILHSYLGSAEMVPGLAKLGAYFSFSGYLMSLKSQKAKKMLKSVPTDRILLESDAPDALPKPNLGTFRWVEGDNSVLQELQGQGANSAPTVNVPPDNEHHASPDASILPEETLNHPANIHCVLKYVASLLEMSEEELAELSYKNTMQLFSYPGSKVSREGNLGVKMHEPSFTHKSSTSVDSEDPTDLFLPFPGKKILAKVNVNKHAFYREKISQIKHPEMSHNLAHFSSFSSWVKGEVVWGISTNTCVQFVF